uniref:Ethylmalonyl-CoA decarboxylase n=1 Tax=Geotrypetes seraphini TaxID=260995 RepID=A0A6P8QBX2_GEOSA|nr:ethylmalonyl-CoA decarboxylase [Geotrypetes seraphini]XP_033793311.1 ethylmalonyl-CoA decarboxylase [Geotrypetes seraphini]XP_033793312.1 ethylmalonyl-CoA decarboxylase [Geotrypetes seraphini]XP_033793313.1 ethylmalonyl-CoA decarboxylase [Geotrypetes seraphini]XP_033793314.1 ethylmalonyl-CoA decarboxylase [Geotrypetes seraphini]XP_033793315.1 ethylmalonyl-CoA decarboxylase [Geotrypetes seraphini]XP_033793316.1 ethylmalonyl-CoA decarboxylase [Geotrypetes seraphini]XP_033793317.1 ethylmalon
MATCIWRRLLLQPVKCRITCQRIESIYNRTHGFDENEIKEKLQHFSGGSIDLSKGNDGIGVLTLNNSVHKNALTGTMMIELQDRVKELEDWTEGRGLVVHGARNTFCSGSDLKAIKAMHGSEEGLKICMFMQNTLTRLKRLPLISVALVQGKALGGGAELSTACDFRLMTPGSEICFVQKHMGLVPGWGGGARLVQIVGGQQSLKLLNGALRMDPAKALNAGLIDDILPSDEGKALEEAQRWLSQYTGAPVEVIQGLKKVVTAGRELPLEDALKSEKEIFGTLWGGPANLQALARGSKHK